MPLVMSRFCIYASFGLQEFHMLMFCLCLILYFRRLFLYLSKTHRFPPSTVPSLPHTNQRGPGLRPPSCRKVKLIYSGHFTHPKGSGSSSSVFMYFVPSNLKVFPSLPMPIHKIIFLFPIFDNLYSSSHSLNSPLFLHFYLFS